jgi:hypothetical protein
MQEMQAEQVFYVSETSKKITAIRRSIIEVETQLNYFGLTAGILITDL